MLRVLGVAVATSVAGCSGGGDTTVGTTTTVDSETTVETTTGSEPTTDAETTTESNTTSDGSTRVVVGPNGDFRFAPSSVTVPVGDTVEWTWSSGGHNILVDSKPEESDWTGTESLEGSVYDAGYSHSHTFDTPGTYAYYCSPHRASGMTGEVVVEE
jgi:plastocyanin